MKDSERQLLERLAAEGKETRLYEGDVPVAKSLEAAGVLPSRGGAPMLYDLTHAVSFDCYLSGNNSEEDSDWLTDATIMRAPQRGIVIAHPPRGEVLAQREQPLTEQALGAV